MTVHVAGRELDLRPADISRVIQAEIARTPRPLRIWYGILVALMAVGGIAALFTIVPGAETFGTTPSFEWGLLIVAYVFFAITTSGLCLASALGTVFGIEMFRPLEKRHAILAVLTLTTAFGIIALDLHYPVRMVFGAVFNPSLASPMWWMGAFYGVYLMFLLVEVWSMFTHRDGIHRYACLASSCTAILAPSTLGAVFAVVFAHAYWYGLFTPITMLVTALLSGAALLGVVFTVVVWLRLAGFERARTLALPAIRLLLAVALTASLVMLARGVIAAWLSDEPDLHAAAMTLISGPSALGFWTRVLAGLIVPLVLVALPRTRTVLGTGLASGLALAGVLLDRYVFVITGQIVPTTTTGGVVSDPYVSYSPSLVEISIVVAAFAFVAFMYTLAERYLDLAEAEAHLGFQLPLVVSEAPRRLRTRLASVRLRRPAPDLAPDPAAIADADAPSDDAVGPP
jgi:molybdopterin-containing oxidoreductase family membrane subunit